jgi:IS5 family transposase
MARPHLSPRLAQAEDAAIALFCLVDDAYTLLNPKGTRYAALKRLSDSEVLTLALLQQLRGVESERSFLRDAERFFSHLFPGVVGLHPSSLHRRARKLGRFLEPLRRAVVGDLVGDPETLIVDSTLLAVLHPRQVRQSAAGFEGAAWAVWGSFAVYGAKLHLICSTNRVPISYELTSANVADVRLVRELLAGAGLEEETVARRLFGDLAYRSAGLEEELAEGGVKLAAERAERKPAVRQQVEVCFAALKRVFGLGQTLAKTLAGLVTRIAAKVTAYTYGLYVNRLLGRPQGRIKELWA